MKCFLFGEKDNSFKFDLITISFYQFSHIRVMVAIIALSSYERNKSKGEKVLKSGFKQILNNEINFHCTHCMYEGHSKCSENHLRDGTI